jgi:hypothetical protein
MSRLTENFVGLDTLGRVCYVKLETPDPANAKKKTRTIYVAATGETVAEAKPINAVDLVSLQTFLDGFFALPAQKRSGYDQYYNNFGPTNPQSPRDLTTQGLVKNASVDIRVLHERVAKGGADGDEAKAALDLLRQQIDTGLQQVLTAERDALLAKFADKFTPDEIAAARAKMGLPVDAAVPAAKIDAAEAVETPAETVNA